MDLLKIPAYELLRQEPLTDIHSEGWILRHKKTGAHVMVIENEDDNKVFQVAFRTPPKDSTGVAHILEHSVLCGSQAFPVKDPFVELVKGSLNTFLNAITFPDRTCYPVASCNDTDFQNLMHVYLDAVFYPNIYSKEEIFRQEGWHYQLDSVDGPLTYNGVVYNEMKGAFSSPDDVLEREIMSHLFPDTCYGVESGGDPDCIPDLTYEQFLAFHRTYYHPSNSYIYLYGDADMAEKLNFIDEAYLSHFDAISVDSEVGVQEPFQAFREAEATYPIAQTEEEEGNTFLSYNVVVEDRSDPYLNEAYGVLEYALLSSPGAPVRQALLKAGIGSDIDGNFEDAFRQSYFSIVARGAEGTQKDEFVRIIRSELTKAVQEGIDEKAILAGIGSQEFRFREADFASYPKGLMYGLGIMGDWIYNEEDAFDQVKILHVFEHLRQQVGTGYYEELVKKALLENPHGCVVVLKPEKGLQTAREKELEEKLEGYLASLSLEEKEELVRKTEALTAYQDAEDTPEDLAKLPRLQREELTRTVRPFCNDPQRVGDTLFLYHEVDTNGIGYLDLLFDLEDFSLDTIHYLGLLKAVLGYIDTKEHTYGELSNEINAVTGGIGFGVEAFESATDPEAFQEKFGIRGKALYGEMEAMFRFVKEILGGSRLDDGERLREIVAELKQRAQGSLQSQGTSTAVLRGSSYASPAALFQDELVGIGYYRFLDELDKHFTERREEVTRELTRVLREVFCKEGLSVSYTGEPQSVPAVRSLVEDFLSFLPVRQEKMVHSLEACERKNEGFSCAGAVQYVAQCGNFLRHGFAFTGALSILKVILSYEYLWMNIRVKGGAYGCMSGFRRNGESYFASYRDPHLDRTLDVFKGIPAYVAEFDVDEQTMTNYIIGAVATKTSPLTPMMQGARSKVAYFSQITQEMVQKELDQILSATKEDIRALAPLIASILSDGQVCVVGSESAVQDAREPLQVQPLY